MHAWLAEGTAVHYFLQATKQKTIDIPEFILAAWRETDFGVGFCLGPNNPRDEIPAFCPPRATSTAADPSPSEMRRLCPSPPPTRAQAWKGLCALSNCRLFYVPDLSAASSPSREKGGAQNNPLAGRRNTRQARLRL